jgi:NTP pyrophosphatase (non-canonical NTP hydrolase)
MTYCIYHIPGKKIGVANDVQERVVRQQGYSEDEFEILEMSEDIGYISTREQELQKYYGYRVDTQRYEDIKNNNITKFNNMDINVTEQTTTFPCPVNKLKGRLMDEIGMVWQTDNRIPFCLTPDSVNWIMRNVSPSQFNAKRCYVYNKALERYFLNLESEAIQLAATTTGALNMSGRRGLNLNVGSLNRFDLIRAWADERGLYDKGDTKTQYLKLMEEAGELGRAILKDDEVEFVDAIGDMVVVLTNLAHLGNVSIEQCIDEAYRVISKRTGKMHNGTFVKDTL